MFIASDVDDLKGEHKPELVPASLILDITVLNEVFKDVLNGLSICSCNPDLVHDLTCVFAENRHSFEGGFCKYRLKQLTMQNSSVLTIQNMRSIVDSETVSNIQRLAVGNPWLLFQDDFKKKQYNFDRLASIKFRGYFGVIVDRGLQNLISTDATKPTNMSDFEFVAVHLRVENDFLKTNTGRGTGVDKIKMYYFLNDYVNFIRQHVVDLNTVLILQHGLRPSDDLHFATAYIKTIYPNTFSLDGYELSSQIHDSRLKSSDSNIRGSDLIGAVFDLLSAQKANMFFGVKGSTFSMWSHYHFLLNNKTSYIHKIPSVVENDAMEEFKNSLSYRVMKKMARTISAHNN